MCPPSGHPQLLVVDTSRRVPRPPTFALALPARYPLLHNLVEYGAPEKCGNGCGRPGRVCGMFGMGSTCGARVHRAARGAGSGDVFVRVRFVECALQ